MKIKTNLRAGKRSGTMLSNSDLGISGSDDNYVAPPPPPPTTRCAGL